MVTKIGSSMLSDVVDALCEEESYQAVYHMPEHDRPMPSLEALSELVERLRAVIFPGYFGDSEIRPETMRYHVGGSLDIAYRILVEQVMRGHCFFCNTDDRTCTDCETAAKRIAAEFMQTLPEMRRLLATDVQAAYVGDPASKSPGETIFCYPSITALTHHRIAHELYKLEVDLIPRIIGEMAHSKTGIDIHPGAQIGDHFFIDHGTGTVIGETCIIGSNVRLYQGVTLGAKSFPQDDSGKLIKGIARHPIVEDNTIVYSGATILGRVTIGAGSVIGGNVWVTRDVEPGARLLQSK
ncbi:serine O-acetyltransferase EpsC [Maridesulfovibrio frigidus]|uniref:serine O-acetyltransferase EpsC n=1 Tax=Maridesulfovibrio frigidus TaxID=340956 RepID=UPI0004E1378D|nr:serine O-acetyltransferase EpsC [Maridesulfovibrio frigidus]